MPIARLVNNYFSIHPDDRGPAVILIQRALQRLGYEVPQDGKFEEATGAAVRQLQREAQLEETGVVNVETANAIDAKIHTLMDEGRDTTQA